MTSVENIFKTISKNSTPEAVGRGQQGPRRWASGRRLRRRDRRAAARAAIKIGDHTEKAMNVNETTPGSVEETVPDENAENKGPFTYYVSHQGGGSQPIIDFF